MNFLEIIFQRHWKDFIDNERQLLIYIITLRRQIYVLLLCDSTIRAEKFCSQKG